MIKNNAKAKIQRSAEQLELELERLQAAYDKLKEAFTQLSKGKMPAGLLLEGGGGASSEELEEERQKVTDLESEAQLTRDENDALKTDIQSLEESLQSKAGEVSELKKDYEVKDLEVRALQMKLRELGAGDDDVDFGGDDDDGPLGEGGLTTNTVAGFKATNPSQNAALAELTMLVNKQKEMLNRVRLENKELKKENMELTDELEEKTRRLALAELQVMRYENARNRVRDGKIKVKISSGKAKPSPIWRNLLDTGGADTGDSKAKVDYERRRRGTILEMFGGLHPIPASELTGGRDGPLEERLYQKTIFVKRWFSLRDSFLFCYESQESSIIEPRFCIPLAESKIGSCPKQKDHEFCFMVLCGTYFNVMASQTESEKNVWLKDLNYAKFVTHENLMNLAHFNKLSIRAIPDPSEQETVKSRFEQSAYSKLGDSSYVHATAGCGGMEGFITCPGLKVMQTARTERTSMFSKDLRKEWKPFYFILRDSHLLMYDLADHSDLITEPKIVFYMGGNVKVIKQHEESENPDDEADDKIVRFYFSVVNMDNEAEAIALYTPTDSERQRWLDAMHSAALCTTRNVLTAAIDKETITVKAGISSTEYDVQGQLLDPMCVQPFDDAQKPIYRHPDGRLLTRDMQTVDIDSKRFSKSGQPLDPYHRPLPPNAVAMFADGPKEPVGVGVDGKFYAYPSGREFNEKGKLLDAEGQKVPEETIKAALLVIDALKTACIVRSALLTREPHPVYDAFGRPLQKTRNGELITREGMVLAGTAATFDACGGRIKYKHPEGGAVKTLEVIYFTNEARGVTIGKVGIEVGRTSIADVHAEVKKALGPKISSISFLVKQMPIPEKERGFRIASDYLPRIVITARDGHGKRMTWDSEPFVVDINHDEIDKLAEKDRETDFVKVVNSQKHRKSVSVSGSSTGRRASMANVPTPRFENTPRM